MSVPVPQGSIFPLIFPNIEIYHRHTDHAQKFSAGRKYVGGAKKSIESVIIQLEITTERVQNLLSERNDRLTWVLA